MYKKSGLWKTDVISGATWKPGVGIARFGCNLIVHFLSICIPLSFTAKFTIYIDLYISIFSAQQSLSTAAVCAIVLSILVIAVLIVAAVLFRKKTYRMPQFRRQERDSSVSFENAMYDVCSSSMVFSEENKS